jgi:hypothetical protein
MRAPQYNVRMPDENFDTGRRGNPLTLPLVIVSVVAAAEAVGLVLLIGALVRRDEPPAPRTPAPAVAMAPAPPPIASTAPAPAPEEPLPPVPKEPSAPTKPAPAAAAARGKVGRRVDSAGFGMTVEKIMHEPATYKDQVRVGPDERYLALLVAVDNNTGGNAQLYPSQFRLQDAMGFGYDPLNVKGTMPALEWTTLANRQTVRGHVDFVVPKSAKSLELVYSGVPHDGAPIQIELGE